MEGYGLLKGQGVTSPSSPPPFTSHQHIPRMMEKEKEYGWRFGD
jgi:hypothetical protein